MNARRHFLLITSEIGAQDVARAGWRRYPLGSALLPRPAVGDRVVVMRMHRPTYVRSALFIGSADVHGDSGAELELRHRFVAPAGHEIPLASLAHLATSRGWTDDRLGALMGQVVPLAPADYEAIEATLRSAALAFGPAPSRPRHARPRTPGRRRLIAARLLQHVPHGR